MTHTIMHVDDDMDTRKAVRALLRSEGYNVISVASGRACLSRLKTERPGLILLDIMMPGMSGWDLFNRIRKIGVDSKVIFLSVLPISKGKIREMRKRGVSDYIMKPFTADELIGKVKRFTAKVREHKVEPVSINSFITRIDHKKRIKVLAEALTHLLVLQTIKSKTNYCQDIIDTSIAELRNLVGPELIEQFLSNGRFRAQDSEGYEKLAEQLRKELLSRHDIFIGSNVLYSCLAKWEKHGIVESEKVKRKKSYSLTDKGEEGMTLLSDYFLVSLKAECTGG